MHTYLTLIAGIVILAGSIILIGSYLGDWRLERMEKEQYLMEREEALKRDALHHELAVKRETVELGEKLIADEHYYMDGLREEVERLENELKNLEEKQIPTREQMDSLLFFLKAENKISNNEALHFMKLYDARNVYPTLKEME